MKVLFVCLGNICRSPTAEGVFKAMVAQDKLGDEIKCDSAGTSGHHEGAPADARSRSHALLRGYDLTSLSRPLTANDFFEFDLILTMDDANYEKVMSFGKQLDVNLDKVKKFTSFCVVHDIQEVPDPYYNGHEGFEHVLDIIEDGCQNLLAQLKLKVPSSLL
jgi:protein-tyrosine phosphatase